MTSLSPQGHDAIPMDAMLPNAAPPRQLRQSECTHRCVSSSRSNPNRRHPEAPLCKIRRKEHRCPTDDLRQNHLPCEYHSPNSHQIAIGWFAVRQKGRQRLFEVSEPSTCATAWSSPSAVVAAGTGERERLAMAGPPALSTAWGIAHSFELMRSGTWPPEIKF